MTDNTKYGKFICARCGHHAIDHQSLPPRTPCTIEGCKCECYVVKIKAHSLYGEFVGGRVEPSGEVKDNDFVSVYPANLLVCLKMVAGMPCVRRKVREYWEDARRDNSFSEKEVERQSKRHIELLVWLAKRFSLPAHWTDEQMTAEIDKMVESYDAGMEELTKLKNGVQALIAKFSASHGKS